MTDQPTTTGRRRAVDFPDAGTPVNAMPSTVDAWDTATAAPTPGRLMIEDAFGYTSDRLDRLEHLLGSLNGTVMRAGVQLEPLLTGSSYDEPDPDTEVIDPHGTPDDRRSTLARRITFLGVRADRLADATAHIERRVEAILDAMEV